jgi:ketosteroid isomerase-like protein
MKAPDPPAGALRGAVAAALCALSLSWSCAGGGQAGDGDWRAGVESVLGAQAEAWNRGDIAGYMEGYWKSDSLLFTSGGNVRRGWTETFAKYSASYDTPEKMGKLSFSDLEVHHPSTGAAWVFGRWKLDRRGDSPGGVFSLVLKKFPEGWRIVHDHTSSDPAP